VGVTTVPCIPLAFGEISDRLPRIETKQGDQSFGAATQMNETDTEVVETLLTDSRETSPKQLAQFISVHIEKSNFIFW
jgi:hypothetical protein